MFKKEILKHFKIATSKDRTLQLTLQVAQLEVGPEIKRLENFKRRAHQRG